MYNPLYDFHGLGQDSHSTKKIILNRLQGQNLKKQIEYVYSFGQSFETNAQKFMGLLFGSQFQESQKMIEQIQIIAKNSTQAINPSNIQSQINRIDQRQFNVRLKKDHLTDSTIQSQKAQSQKAQDLLVIQLYQGNYLFSTQIVHTKESKVSNFIKQLQQRYGIYGIRLTFRKHDDAFEAVAESRLLKEFIKQGEKVIQFRIAYGLQSPFINQNSLLQFKEPAGPSDAVKAKKGQFVKLFPQLDQIYQNTYSQIEQVIGGLNPGSQDKENYQKSQVKVTQVMNIIFKTLNLQLQCHPKAQLKCRDPKNGAKHCLKTYGNFFNPELNLRQGDQLVRYSNGQFTYHQIKEIKIINKRGNYNKDYMFLRLKVQKPILLDGFGFKFTSKLIYFSDKSKKLLAQLQDCSGQTVKDVKQKLENQFLKQGKRLKKFCLEYKRVQLMDDKKLNQYDLIENSMVIINLKQQIEILEKPEENLEQNQQLISCWFGGQSRIYLDNSQYQYTLEQMYNLRNIFATKEQSGYDHKFQNCYDFQIQGVQRKSFLEYIIIDFESENQGKEKITCHPNVHFKSQNNIIKSFKAQKQNFKLKEGDEIKVFQDITLKVKKIQLVKKQVELFKANIFNKDKNMKAHYSINSAQFINQDWTKIYKQPQSSFQFRVSWKGQIYKFDFAQNQHLTFKQCFFSSMNNLPKRFIIFCQHKVLNSSDKIQEMSSFFNGQSYYDITISMSQNLMLFSKKSKEVLNSKETQIIQSKSQTKQQLPIQKLKQLYHKAENLQNFTSELNNKVLLIYNNFKFSHYYGTKQTFFWDQFQFASTQTLKQVQNEIASQNCTIFQIQTYSAKILKQKANSVLILPFVYYYVWSIQKKKIVKQNKTISYQLVKIHQLKQPTFKSDIIIWTDDVPQNNASLIQDIKQIYSNVEFIQMRSTSATIAWIKQFAHIFTTCYRQLQIKIISDMVRNQQAQQTVNARIPNYFAGLQLVQYYKKIYNFTDRILIYCGDKKRAKQQAQKRGLGEIQLNYQITQEQDRVTQFCNFEKKQQKISFYQNSQIAALSEWQTSSIHGEQLSSDTSASMLKSPQRSFSHINEKKRGKLK